MLDSIHSGNLVPQAETSTLSHIAMNWRGAPLVSLATIVRLIGSTHSRSGLLHRESGTLRSLRALR